MLTIPDPEARDGRILSEVAARSPEFASKDCDPSGPS